MKSIKYIILSTVIFILAGCASNLHFLSGGTMFEVDADKHFKEDITYSIGSCTFTFRSDGSFELIEQEYEASNDINANSISNEGWVQIDGDKGTYTWDSKTFLATVTFTKTFVDTNGWVDLKPSADKTTISTMFFGSRYVCPALMRSSNNSSEYSLIETSVDGENIKDETITTLTFSGTTQIESVEVTSMYSNDVLFSRKEIKDIYPIVSTFPAEKEFSTYTTMTFNALKKIRTRRTFDIETSEWSTNTSAYTNNSSKVLTYANSGFFIIPEPSLVFMRNKY